VPILIRVSLEEDSSGCMLGGIRGDGEGGREIGEVKDWFQQEEGFKSVEGGLAGRGPVPLEILFGQIDEGAGDIGVVGDESPIEVCKAEERAHIFDLGGSGPFGDSVKLDGVHSELPWFDDHS